MSQTEDYNNLRVNKQKNILTSHLDIAIYVNTSCDTGNRKKCLTRAEFTFKSGSGKIFLTTIQNYTQKELKRKNTIKREAFKC